MTSLGDRLTPEQLAGLLDRSPHIEDRPAVTTPIPAPRRPLKNVDLPAHERLLLTVAGWNHPCGRGGCTTWVPNHRRHCLAHADVNTDHHGRTS